MARQAIWNHWPFRSGLPTGDKHPTLWQFLLGDRFTLGLVRLGLVALGIYVVVSVPALISASRWLKGFGKDGLAADDPVVIGDLQKEVRRLTAQVDKVGKERDEALQLNARLVESIESDLPETTS